MPYVNIYIQHNKLLYPERYFRDTYLLGYDFHPTDVLLLWKTWDLIHLLEVISPYPHMCLQAPMV